MQDIFSALPALLVKHADNEDVRRTVIFAVWKKIAGESLTSHAVPVALAGDRLTVAVADRNWQRNLAELSKEMIFKMNFIFGEPQVKFVNFIIDPAAVHPVKPKAADGAMLESDALDQISEPLRKAADTIQNDELRRRFLLAAGSCLAREGRLAAK